jgi:hypothetical protein
MDMIFKDPNLSLKVLAVGKRGKSLRSACCCQAIKKGAGPLHVVNTAVDIHILKGPVPFFVQSPSHLATVTPYGADEQHLHAAGIDKIAF